MDQPHSLEAEESLLACCLLDNASYDSITTIVNAELPVAPEFPIP